MTLLLLLQGEAEEETEEILKINFHAHPDFHENYALNFVLEPIEDATPSFSGDTEGRMIWSAYLKRPIVWDGDQWIVI